MVMLKDPAVRLQYTDRLGVLCLQVQNELIDLYQYEGDGLPLNPTKLGRLVASLDRMGSCIGALNALVRSEVGPVSVDLNEVHDLEREARNYVGGKPGVQGPPTPVHLSEDHKACTKQALQQAHEAAVAEARAEGNPSLGGSDDV